MKTLHILRHAKSAWDQAGLSDRDRPLNGRGRRDAPRMGKALGSLLAVPSAIAVSPACRAQQTLAGVGAGWPELAAAGHRVEEALYTFSVADVLSWLAEQQDTLDELLIIGHNPALTELVNYLSPADYLPNLPTAGYVRLALDIPRWRDLREDCGALQQMLLPKQL